MITRTCKAGLAAGVLAMALAGSAADALGDTITLRGASFPLAMRVGEQPLAMRGAGVLHYLRVVPVYAAALYVAPNGAAGDPLGDHAKRLEVEYFVDARAAQFNEAGDRVLRDVLPDEAYQSLKPRLDQLAGWFPDPREGDRCALTYIPGRGTELWYNGRVLGTVPGEDFQRAYFHIWLGEQAASRPLRRALLGDPPPPSPAGSPG